MNQPHLPSEGDRHLSAIESLGEVEGPSEMTTRRHLAALRADVASATADDHRAVRLRPRRRRVAIGVIGIAAALLAVAAMDVRPTRGNRADAASIERLAARAGDVTPIDPNRPVLHLTYRASAAGEGELNLETWRRVDGSGVERTTPAPSEHQRSVIPPSDAGASAYAWNEGTQTCSLRRAGDAGIRRTIQGRRIDFELLASLPRDPKELRSELEHLVAPLGTRADDAPLLEPTPDDEPSGDAREQCEGSDPRWVPTEDQIDPLIIDAVTMLLGPWSGPELRAAAFRVLADIPGVAVDDQTDPLGRDAVACVRVTTGDDEPARSPRNTRIVAPSTR